MAAQQVFTKVTVKLTPHGVHMVRCVLSVIVFEQEVRSLNAVVMTLIGFQAAGPGEVHSLPVVDRRSSLNLFQDGCSILVGELPHQIEQHLLLCGRQLVECDALWRLKLVLPDSSLCRGDNVAGAPLRQ